MTVRKGDGENEVEKQVEEEDGKWAMATVILWS